MVLGNEVDRFGTDPSEDLSAVLPLFGTVILHRSNFGSPVE
jgi:hypothetical protein